MGKSRQFLRKSVLACLSLFSFCSACFSEKYYSISETELTEIEFQTDQLMISVETLTETVRKQTESIRTLESQRNEYMTLSGALETENTALRSKVRTYRLLTVSISAGAIIGGLTAYMMRK